jgi:hypothetical protein
VDRPSRRSAEEPSRRRRLERRLAEARPLGRDDECHAVVAVNDGEARAARRVGRPSTVVLGPEEALRGGAAHRREEGLRAGLGEYLVEALRVAVPSPRSPMDDLGEERLRGRAFQECRSPSAASRSESSRTDEPRRADHDRESQSVFFGFEGKSAKPFPLVLQPLGGDDARRSRGPRAVRLLEPLTKLALEIRAVVESADLEEGRLHPADEVLDRGLLVRAARPAELGSEAEVERCLTEGRVPLDHAIFPERPRRVRRSEAAIAAGSWTVFLLPESLPPV